MIVDNCEHVVDAVAGLAERLLAACPRLRIVATSREPLRLEGEQQVAVGSMTDDDAVALFTARALAVQPGFATEPARSRGAVPSPRRLAIGDRAGRRGPSHWPPQRSWRLVDRFGFLIARRPVRIACARCARRSRGATTCSSSTSSGCSGRWQCSPAGSRSPPPRRCAVRTHSRSSPGWSTSHCSSRTRPGRRPATGCWSHCVTTASNDSPTVVSWRTLVAATSRGAPRWPRTPRREEFPCRIAWGHDAENPGYMSAAWSSEDGRHQVVVIVNTNTTHDEPVATAMRALLATAYCER